MTATQHHRAILDPPGTEWAYSQGVPAGRLDALLPDARTLGQGRIYRPGNRDVQLALFPDHPNSFDHYPAFRKYFREVGLPALVIWGRNDEIFGPAGAETYRRDLPDAEIHLLDAGHSVPESRGPELATLVRDFLDRSL